VNSYLSALVTPRLFGFIAIGKTCNPSDELPRVALKHMRFIALYRYAFMANMRLQSQLRSTRILGIRCESSLGTIYWSELIAFMPVIHTPIVQLALRLSFLSLQPDDLKDFTVAMVSLARTVRMASFDLRSSSELCKPAFGVIKRKFTELNSLQFINIDSYSESWALSRDWVCTSGLRKLELHKCRMSYYNTLTKFIAYQRNVVHLRLNSCIPTDAAENTAFLGLQTGRMFELLDVPSWYDDHPYFGGVAILRYKSRPF
jgi:hypothetical protein